MDVLELQKQLTSSGMRDDLSRDLIRFIEQRPELATKHDLEVLQKTTKHDLEALSKEFDAKLQKAIGGLAWKIAGFLVAQAAVIVTLIKLL